MLVQIVYTQTMENKKKIALVCVAKEEDLYLQEWIDYHLKLGFDDIHIFQNNWRFANVIPNDRVHFHEWDINTYDSDTDPIWMTNLQAKCYTDFGRNHHEEYEWAAFFDVDEFLVIKEHNDVKEFITDYDDHNCLVITWALFGDNGIDTFDEEYASSIERFTKRWDSAHTQGYYQFKSICKLSEGMVHNTHWAEGEWIDPNHNTGDGPYNYKIDFSRAQLNHYYTRTLPEWVNKVNKTRCDMAQTEPNKDLLKPEAFTMHNFNDVEDLYALEFFKN